MTIWNIVGEYCRALDRTRSQRPCKCGAYDSSAHMISGQPARTIALCCVASYLVIHLHPHSLPSPHFLCFAMSREFVLGSGIESAATLSPDEKFWASRQPYLESRGYLLRPRFRPGWVPSWKVDGGDFFTAEDALMGPVCVSRYAWLHY